MKLINFINSVLKTNRVVHWTWKYNHSVKTDDTIAYETNGVVNDYHYNEKTHQKLYETMINEFNNTNHISIDLWKEYEFPKDNLALTKLI